MQTSSTRDNNILFIIKLMFFIEEHLPKRVSRKLKNKRGRKSKLSDLELLTILAYDGLTEQHQTILGIYKYMKREYSDCFNLPRYQNFAAHCLRIEKLLEKCLRSICKDSEIAFWDSTPLEVCQPIRVASYKVLDRRSVGFTKNLMGWFFGFKLHLSVDKEGNILAFHISRANRHDRKDARKLITKKTKQAAGDQHYGGRPLVSELKALGVEIVSSAQAELRTEEEALLKQRSIVETAFSSLKNKYKLVTNHPKDKTGYMFHYLKTLFSCQMNKVFSSEVLIS